MSLRRALVGVLCLAMAGQAVPAWADADSDFFSRCAEAGVLRCIGFDSAADITGRTDYVNDPAPFGLLDDGSVAPRIDTAERASGAGSLLFTIPSNSGSSDGSYWIDFSDDFSVQFGVGEDFYIQWRQRFSADFLNTTYYSDYTNRVEAGGWKQVIIGEGDRTGTNIYSCTDLEIVVNDGNQRGFPQMYHSCGAKDGQYEGLQEPFGSFDFYLQNAIRSPPCAYHSPNVPPCVGYAPDEWMTFQVHVHVGTPYTNNRVYRHDSVIQLWVGHEGEPSTLVIDYGPRDPSCDARQSSQPACQTGYDLFNDNAALRKYGQIWLLPYHTAKDSAQPHPEGYTWYDELIVSRNPIADPLEMAPPSQDAGIVPGRDAGAGSPDGGTLDGAGPPADSGLLGDLGGAEDRGQVDSGAGPKDSGITAMSGDAQMPGDDPGGESKSCDCRSTSGSGSGGAIWLWLFAVCLWDRRTVLRGMGAALAVTPIVQLIGCGEGEGLPLDAGTPGDEGVLPGDAGFDGDAGSSSDTQGADSGVIVPWATGGTAAMSGNYPDPFAGGMGAACQLICASTLGPCYAQTMERMDISEGELGLPVRLAFLVVDQSCNPIENAAVDIWHTSATGLYSGADASDMCTFGDAAARAGRWFRGVQTTDAAGRADFNSCFPGWYRGRTIHIHFTVRLASMELVTSQLFFDDILADDIIGSQPIYNARGQRDTTNQNDNVIGRASADDYLFRSERMPDGALLASKALIIRSSLATQLCTL